MAPRQKLAIISQICPRLWIRNRWFVCFRQTDVFLRSRDLPFVFRSALWSNCLFLKGQHFSEAIYSGPRVNPSVRTPSVRYLHPVSMNETSIGRTRLFPVVLAKTFRVVLKEVRREATYIRSNDRRFYQASSDSRALRTSAFGTGSPSIHSMMIGV